MNRTRTSTDIALREKKASKKYIPPGTIVPIALLLLHFKAQSDAGPDLLDVTNIILAVAVGILVLIVVRYIVAEFTSRKKELKDEHGADQHLKDILSEVGLTMQDGGEKADPLQRDREGENDDMRATPPG